MKVNEQGLTMAGIRRTWFLSQAKQERCRFWPTSGFKEGTFDSSGFPIKGTVVFLFFFHPRSLCGNTITDWSVTLEQVRPISERCSDLAMSRCRQYKALKPTIHFSIRYIFLFSTELRTIWNCPLSCVLQSVTFYCYCIDPICTLTTKDMPSTRRSRSRFCRSAL